MPAATSPDLPVMPGPPKVKSPVVSASDTL
jgi:hypothetical protein